VVPKAKHLNRMSLRFEDVDKRKVCHASDVELAWMQAALYLRMGRQLGKIARHIRKLLKIQESFLINKKVRKFNIII